MGSDAGKRIGAVGRRDAWMVDPSTLYSPRSNPQHEEHDAWKARTDPADPEMLILLDSMRLNGTDEGVPIIVYSDGGKTCIAAGDRRHAASNIVNRERKAKRLSPLQLRALTTKDPIAARALENACRRDDPPMVIARRYRANAATMGDAAAAAACGVTLAMANALRKCLGLDAATQAKVNARELPADVAARMVGAGSEAAADAIRASTDKATGKVNASAAKAEARRVAPVVHRTSIHPRTLAKVVAALASRVRNAHVDAVLLGMRIANGTAEEKDVPEAVKLALIDAGWTAKGAGA